MSLTRRRSTLFTSVSMLLIVLLFSTSCFSGEKVKTKPNQKRISFFDFFSPMNQKIYNKSDSIWICPSPYPRQKNAEITPWWSKTNNASAEEIACDGLEKARIEQYSLNDGKDYLHTISSKLSLKKAEDLALIIDGVCGKPDITDGNQNNWEKQWQQHGNDGSFFLIALSHDTGRGGFITVTNTWFVLKYKIISMDQKMRESK